MIPQMTDYGQGGEGCAVTTFFRVSFNTYSRH